MDSATFYAAARERLAGVTDDAAGLTAFDQLAERAAEGDDDRTDAALGSFLRETRRLKLSLDYLFCGAGEPHMKWEDA